VLLATAHIVVLAVLPVILAVRAVKQREPLAWPATGVTAAVLVFALINFF
jgi:heme A synthase